MRGGHLSRRPLDIAAQLGLELVGAADGRGGHRPRRPRQGLPRPAPKALYLNPTLQNPTTLTIPEGRREAIAAVARHHGLPIIEDDAYGFIPTGGVHPIASIAPDLTWHIAGLAKCIGAGLRAAYVVAPDARSGWPFAAALRASNVMASPLTVALATRWIDDGTADMILRFIRTETAARQKLAAAILPAARSAPIRSRSISGCRCPARGPARPSSATCARRASESWPAMPSSSRARRTSTCASVSAGRRRASGCARRSTSWRNTLAAEPAMSQSYL